TVLVQFIKTGVVVPNISYAILTTMLCLTGLQILVFGLIADMLKYQRIREEEILYRLKKIEME
ncbi:MAG TPA: glycosyltransferase family 2 protein, partial [Methanomethylovorans sp.]|nr:glycosyltransferase family 2 protein [Methanomethylovorans sp.]